MCVFKSKTFIITFYCILCYRDPVPKRGNLHALLPVTIPLPYTIQVRLLYILTGGDVIETSCMWNFIKVLCLDTSQTFCFGTENFFFLSLSLLSLLLTLTMELSERLIQVKSAAKDEKDFPSYTQDDVVFFVWGCNQTSVTSPESYESLRMLCAVPSCIPKKECQEHQRHTSCALWKGPYTQHNHFRTG